MPPRSSDGVDSRHWLAGLDEHLSTLAFPELLSVLKKVRTAIHTAARTELTSGDPLGMIVGQESAKRATAVARVGRFSLTYVGAAGSGKTLLRRMATHLGLFETGEATLCPCGLRSSQRRCLCTAEEIARHRRDWPVTDMYVMAHSVPLGSLDCLADEKRRQPLKALAQHILQAKRHPVAEDPQALSQASEKIREMYEFSTAMVDSVRRIARAIAQYNLSPQTTLADYLEAACYVRLDTL